ncbi:MAG TPA: helix-hairpin-helix domain-containing protein [Fimbriimonadaceae bacterium]|nr:helix-hairpin-helix domain-containing protein [Fimbriimonadaceae bacterium]
MKRNRGSAFIMALIAVVILTMVVASAANETRIVQRSQLHRLEQRKAERMARSGVNYVLAQLQNLDTSVVTLNDPWAQIGDSGSQQVTVGGGSFRLQVLDAGSMVNLNNMSQEQLQQLPLTADQIDSILDWREPDLQPRVDGAKDQYYNSLDQPYNTKLRNFDTVDELLQVKGITPNVLYQPQQYVSGTALTTGSTQQQLPLYDLLTVDSRAANVTSTGQTKVNVNTVNTGQLVQAGLTQQVAQALVQRRNFQGTFTSWTQIFQVPGVTMQNASTLLDALTLDGAATLTGRVNVNTATEQALNLLPGMTPDVTQAILSRQGTFEGLGDLVGVPGLTLPLLGQIAGSLTTSSQAFVVLCQGRFGGSTYALRAVIDVDDAGPRIVKVEKSPYTDVITQWGWDTDPSTETVLIQSN